MWAGRLDGAPEKIEATVRAAHQVKVENIGWSVGLLVAAYAIGRVVTWLTVRVLARWARHTANEADDLVLKHLARPLRWLVPLAAVDGVLPLLSLPATLARLVAHATVIAIILGTGWAVFGGLRVVEELIEVRYDLAKSTTAHARALHTQLRALRNIGGFIIVMVTLAFALMTFEEVRNIGAGLLASAGVAGIALGFAAQKTLTTLFAGVQIAFAQPIRVGDFVTLDGQTGTIEEIALTYVLLRVWDERCLVVPVQYFLDKPFLNWTRGASELLGTVDLWLDFRVPVEAIRQELLRYLRDAAAWDKRVGSVNVTDANERAMLVRVLVSAKNVDDLWTLRCDVRERLLAYVRETFPEALPRTRVALDAPPPSRGAAA